MFNDIDVFSGLMVARTALNSPEIFSLISDKEPKTKQENIRLFTKLSKKYNLEIKYQKNNLLQLVSGFSGSKRLRERYQLQRHKKKSIICLYPHFYENTAFKLFVGKNIYVYYKRKTGYFLEEVIAQNKKEKDKCTYN